MAAPRSWRADLATTRHPSGHDLCLPRRARRENSRRQTFGECFACHHLASLSFRGLSAARSTTGFELDCRRLPAWRLARIDQGSSTRSPTLHCSTPLKRSCPETSHASRARRSQEATTTLQPLRDSGRQGGRSSSASSLHTALHRYSTSSPHVRRGLHQASPRRD